MERFTVKQFVTLSVFIVNLHRKYLPNVAQSKELASALQRITIATCNMLKDLTPTTQESMYLKEHTLKCIDAINENKGIIQADTIVLDLSTAQLVEVIHCIEYATDEGESSWQPNDPEILYVVRSSMWFLESIKQKVLEEMCTEIDL
jgi:hypothetical protein